MDDVKRYCTTWDEQAIYDLKTVVSSADYDAALAREDALQEELAKFKAGCVDLQQRLTVAEQRAGELEVEVARLNRVKLSLKELAENRADNCSVYRHQLEERDTLLGLGLSMINRGIVSFDDQCEYRQKLAACVGFSAARLEQTGDSPVDCANKLQQRLTVAEQRAGKMEDLLREAYEAGDHNIFGTDLDSRIEAALKPAAEGEGS